MIRKHNKLIGLAAKSEAGWAIVEEYQTDELASDTDDDRKIRRAEKAALEKKKTMEVQAEETTPITFWQWFWN